MKIKISDNLTLDLHSFREEGVRITILARSGGGKSNLVRLILEQLLTGGYQICVIEPVSEYYTLKSKFNDIIWISNQGDLQIHPEASSIYAEILENGGSLIVSAGDIDDELEEKMFVASLLQSVYQRWKRIRRPIFLVIEDAEGYAPQLWSREDRYCLSTISKIAKRGRKLGINLILASQRPAELHKSVWSQSNILFIGGFKTTRDLLAIKDMSRILHLPIDVAELANFRAGEFYSIFSGEATRIVAYMCSTPHGGETPELMPISSSLKPHLDRVKAELEEALKKREYERDIVKKLTKEVEALRRENEELKKKLETINVIKEIPIQVKTTLMASTPSSYTSLEGVPEAVLKCPYTGALKVYKYLQGVSDYVKISEISANTGVGINTVKKIVRYLKRKGLVKSKLVHKYGKNYISRVKLK